MAPLFRDLRITQYDVIAIQEPWRNPENRTTHHPLTGFFHLFYSTRQPDTRTCFYINTKIGRGDWTVADHSPDLCTLKLTYGTQKLRRRIHIHNVYHQPLDNLTSTFEGLQTALQAQEPDYQDIQHLVVGNFNLHHPLWSGVEPEETESKTRWGNRIGCESLLELVDEHELQLLTRPGTATYIRGTTTPSTLDLTFCSPGLSDKVISCQVQEDIDHDSDHYPVETCLQLHWTERDQPVTNNGKR